MIEFALVYMIGTIIINQDQTFKNVNDCINFKQILNNQTITKDKEEDIYQCMCKLVPNIDSEKVRVY